MAAEGPMLERIAQLARQAGERVDCSLYVEPFSKAAPCMEAIKELIVENNLDVNIDYGHLVGSIFLGTLFETFCDWYHGESLVVWAIRERRANLEAPRKWGNSCYHDAICGWSRTLLITLLGLPEVRAHVPVDVTNEEGHTPLSLLLQQSDETYDPRRFAYHLIDCGARLDLVEYVSSDDSVVKDIEHFSSKRTHIRRVVILFLGLCRRVRCAWGRDMTRFIGQCMWAQRWE